MSVKSLYDKVVLNIDAKQEIVASNGLSYVKNMSLSNNTTMIGKVVAVGEGRLLANGSIVPMKVKVGDRVLYSKMQGESYNDGESDLVILSESCILAILED